MRLLRALTFGPLVAGGAYCVGFVASRLVHELYPWAGPVFDALLPGWVALAAATAGFYGYFSQNAKLRGCVLAATFIVTVTGFYAVAVELIDEHHETALRQKQESLQMVLGLLGRSTARENRCERFLLEERLAMTGDLTPNDACHSQPLG